MAVCLGALTKIQGVYRACAENPSSILRFRLQIASCFFNRKDKTLPPQLLLFPTIIDRVNGKWYVKVRWDDGRANSYETGRNGKYAISFEDAVPGAPRDLAVSGVTDNSISITWSPPARRGRPPLQRCMFLHLCRRGSMHVCDYSRVGILVHACEFLRTRHSSMFPTRAYGSKN